MRGGAPHVLFGVPPERGSIHPLVLQVEALALAVVAVEEAADLGEESVAVDVPLVSAAEELHGLAQAGEADFLGSSFAEVGDLVPNVGEEGELEAIAGLAGCFFQ